MHQVLVFSSFLLVETFDLDVGLVIVVIIVGWSGEGRTRR
jgi:hypothetical protein